MFAHILRTLAASSGRMIATYRAMLGLLLLLLAMIDPEGIGFEREIDDIVLAGYAMVALVLLAISLKSWWLEFRLFPYAYVLDFAVFVVIRFVLDPMMQGYIAIAVGTATFIMVETMSRWNWQKLVVATVTLNLLCWASSLAVGMVNPHGLSVIDDFLRQAGIFGFVSIIMVWTGYWRSGLQLPAPFPRLPASDEMALRHMIEYATEASGGTVAAISWLRPDASEAQFASNLGEDEPLPGHVPPLHALSTAPVMVFDRARRRALVPDGNGDIRLRRLTPGQCAMLGKVGVDNGLFVRLEAMTGSGGLLIGGLPALDWSLLERGSLIGSKVSRGLDDYRYALLAQETAVISQRRSIARDLHDSIAQSLAGAKFWLQSYRNRLQPDSEQAREIDRMKSAFEAEYDNLRLMIARLQCNELDNDRVDLVADLEGLAELLGQHWRCEVAVHCHPRILRVPASLSHDVQQMVREAVSNAVRHGEATRVAIDAQATEADIALAIDDNGHGFRSPSPSPPASLADRANQLGGSLNITTRPGNTRLDFRFPRLEWQ